MSQGTHPFPARKINRLISYSDTTKHRFFTTYYIPDPTSASASTTPFLSPHNPKTHTKSKSLDPSKLKHHSLDSSPSHFPDPPLSSTPFLVPLDHNSHRDPATASRNSSHAKALFNTAVIELVRIIQAALVIFGFFPAPNSAPQGSNPNIDGLLCDSTVDGIQRWVAEIGEPCLGVEVRGLLPPLP
jgi:hypothetical protein